MIKLQFNSKEIEDKFMGQFSDGWGENLVEFDRNGNVLNITWFEGIDYRSYEDIIKAIGKGKENK